MKRIIILSMVFIMLMAFGSVNIAAAEYSLDEILDGEYESGYWEEVFQYVFSPGGYEVEVISEIIGAQSGYSNPVGWYDVSDVNGTMKELFSDDGVSGSITFETSVNFGLYTDTNGTYTYYTEDYLNWDGHQHARIFRVDKDKDGTKDAFVVAFEDLPFGGDNDYQDVVIELEGEGLTLIPEFPTIALPIATILGLMFIISSRKKKE